MTSGKPELPKNAGARQEDETPGALSRAGLMGLGAAGCVAAVLFLIPWDFGPDAWFWRRVADLAHVPILAGLAFVLHLLLLRRYSPLNSAGLAVIGSTVFMLAVEALQPLTGRSASWLDLVSGLAGVFFAIAFLLFNRTGRTDLERNVSFLLAALSGGMLMLLVEPVALGWRALSWRDAHFPVLSDFSTINQQFLWEPLPEERPALILQQPGVEHLRIKRSDAPLSGISYRAGIQDWSGFQALELDLENPSNYPLTLGLRIDDTGDVSTLSGRYQEPIMLDPGRQTVQIPLQDISAGPDHRVLELSQIIRGVLFFAEPEEDDFYAELAEEPNEFYLWSARLTRGREADK